MRTERFTFKFGVRTKIVPVQIDEKQPIIRCLEKAVRQVLSKDRLLKDKANKDFFLEQFNEFSNCIVEIDENTMEIEIDNSIPISFVFWEDQDFTIPTKMKETNKNLQTSQDDDDDDELAFVKSIGVHTRKRSTAAQEVGGPASSSKGAEELSDPPAASASIRNPRRQRRTKANQQDSSPELGEYEERMLLNRENNRRILEELRGVEELTPKSSVKAQAPRHKKRKRTKQNVENSNIERRIMPSRTSKTKSRNESVPAVSTSKDFDDDLEDIVSDEDREQSEPAGPLGKRTERNCVKRQRVVRWNENQNPTVMGKIITKFTPLPPFPRKLEESLNKGVYNSKLMNDFLKAHIKDTTEREHPTKSEYKILSIQVVKRLTSLGVVGAQSYSKKIGKSLSASIRGHKSYAKNVKPRRKSKREQAFLVEVQNKAAAQPQEPLDELDEILKKPVQNKRTVINAIKGSTTRIQYFMSNTVQQVIATYPYLKHADLLVHEYTTRVPILLEEAQKNVSDIFPALAHVLNKNLPENEVQKIELFKAIETLFLEEDDDPVWPSIQFWDSANKRNAVPLNDVPAGQSPAIVVLKNGTTELESVSLVFDTETISTLKEPSAFDCVVTLLGGYFSYIEYPKPYRNHLEIFETIVNGGLEEDQHKRHQSTEVDEFLRKLLLAKKSMEIP